MRQGCCRGKRSGPTGELGSRAPFGRWYHLVVTSAAQLPPHFLHTGASLAWAQCICANVKESCHKAIVRHAVLVHDDPDCAAMTLMTGHVACSEPGAPNTQAAASWCTANIPAIASNRTYLQVSSEVSFALQWVLLLLHDLLVLILYVCRCLQMTIGHEMRSMLFWCGGGQLSKRIGRAALSN